MNVGEIEIRDLRQVDVSKIRYSDQARHYKALNTKARIYFSFKDETILDNLEKRKCRPHTTLRKEVVPQVLRKMGMDPKTKVRWSQYAGCSCPCSPGFIVEDHSAAGKTVWVTVSE